jgi:amino acid transporter
METESNPSLRRRLRKVIIGKPRSPHDRHLFHKLSLIAFFAWVGLGADGLSSSCYGPQEAFLALGRHPYLGIFVALGSALTIFVITSSYSQIVELFPTGGGGYVVASKLLSPGFGMLSGCALLIDYVLTITVSLASGADALFSFLPASWYGSRLIFALGTVVLLTLMNMRGIKESVIALVPIFLTFVITHAIIIVYALVTHFGNFPEISRSLTADLHQTTAEIGFIGMIFIILRSYSMGAGTYTGIEAVSNNVQVLREPRARTATRTMVYMAGSLAFMVLGLAIGYLLFGVDFVPTKTLNAVLFEKATGSWGDMGRIFVLVALVSEAAILFVGAQSGFMGGPAVLANMAKDRWVPTQFSTLSDRFVTQNGILIMGGAAFLLMLLTHGSVRFLVVLYAINVFITFSLSQLGMVRHWWLERKTAKRWLHKILVNGIGLTLTLFILLSMVILKFHQGGWITLLITGTLIVLVTLIRRHYKYTARLLQRLDSLVKVAEMPSGGLTSDRPERKTTPEFDPKARTAVLLVNGFSGLGLHTLLSVIRTFQDSFKNFIFIQIGVLDSGNFKGSSEIEHLKTYIETEVGRYVDYARRYGYYAEGFTRIGVDVVEEVAKLVPEIAERFPHPVFFGGQLVFPNETVFNRVLHNYTVFAVQRRLYNQGIPIVIMPIRVY